jgi:hypothetical protein
MQRRRLCRKFVNWFVATEVFFSELARVAGCVALLMLQAEIVGTTHRATRAASLLIWMAPNFALLTEQG